MYFYFYSIFSSPLLKCDLKWLMKAYHYYCYYFPPSPLTHSLTPPHVYLFSWKYVIQTTESTLFSKLYSLNYNLKTLELKRSLYVTNVHEAH